MTGLTFLIPIALALGLFGLAMFFWALRAGQFEDLDGASLRILLDDDELVDKYDAGSTPAATGEDAPKPS